jgi:hypothetical protein
MARNPETCRRARSIDRAKRRCRSTLADQAGLIAKGAFSDITTIRLKHGHLHSPGGDVVNAAQRIIRFEYVQDVSSYVSTGDLESIFGA